MNSKESKIRQRRELLGMSREQLARLSGIPMRTIQGWETKAYTPRVDKLSKVAKVLNCKMEDLI